MSIGVDYFNSFDYNDIDIFPFPCPAAHGRMALP